MYIVYILKSEKDDEFYIGYTSNLLRRIDEHQKGLVESTKHRRPIKLFYFEGYMNQKLAIEREAKLKHFGSAYTALLKRLKVKY